MPNQPSDYKSFVRMAEDMNFLVLDTETTGLKKPAEICQISIIKSDGKVLLDSFVKTVNPIPGAAEAIHGISTSDVAHAPTWTQLRPTLVDFLQNQTIVVYNAKFDRNMFHLSDEASGLQHYDWQGLGKWYCAMVAFAERFGPPGIYGDGSKWKKLIEAVSFYACDQREAHTSLNDCLMTLDVVKCMVAEFIFNDNMARVPFVGEMDDAYDNLGICPICQDRYITPGEGSCHSCRTQDWLDKYD